jgi:hypothetical protein
MQQTYSSRLEYEVGRLIDEAIADETSVLVAGSIEDIKDYKMRVGMIRGLYKAKELISEADTIIQSGERS